MSEFGTIWDDVNGPSSGKIEDPDIQAEHNLKFKAIKSQEEIEKLTLDENISPLDRAFIIIKYIYYSNMIIISITSNI